MQNLKHQIIPPLKPKSNEWTELELPASITLGYDGSGWLHKHGFYVISSVEVMADENKGPEYHLSMSFQTSKGPARVTSSEAKWILDQFGLEGAEEDNHVPYGIARNFWRTVAEPLIGLECPCKEEEPAIRENKGDFVWRPVSK